MSYKTILVHLSDKRRAEPVLEPALHLARRYGSHVIGLYTYPAVAVLPPVPLPYSAEVAGALAAAERREAEAIKAIFDRMTAGLPLVAEWRVIKAPHADLAAQVMRHARSADLVVAGQADPDWEMSPVLDFPDRLAIECGRPVLVVPYTGHYPEVGRNVVIAWKAGREAARAVFDALPILKQAGAVQILEVSDGGSERDTEIAAALGRHGIKPVVKSSAAGDISVGDEILSRLADAGADLLVMGAYGHSRLTEFVFGGVTRHILGHMTVPTLFSH